MRSVGWRTTRSASGRSAAAGRRRLQRRRRPVGDRGRRSQPLRGPRLAPGHPALSVARPDLEPALRSRADAKRLRPRPRVPRLVRRGLYRRAAAGAGDPSASPLLHPIPAGMPAMVILAAECDPLFDEARLYAERLRRGARADDVRRGARAWCHALQRDHAPDNWPATAASIPSTRLSAARLGA